MSTSTSFASSFPSSTAAADPFAARHHKSLPRELRNESAGMTWSAFECTYAPSSGPYRLGSWSETKTGPGMWDFEATLGIGESICKTGASAPGPVAAMTSMLYDAGCPMEILSFHQHEIGHRTATFLLCESDGIRLWAMGIGESHTESTLRAMISGANRLRPA
ncbi:MAG: 2-isopropylmalate synthase [Rhodococcus sp. (in: high G+C Gram-positive bacteria)]|nr:MAG: 2-isopropylmalate synthase [Rhodococcus sp. (in: high G+C Gram-positive bacteria)]